MMYRLLADAVVVIHLLFMLFALFGGLLGLWRRWLLFLHLPTALWISVISFAGWICPLTPLENKLRIAGGEAGYAGGFVEYYLIPLIYPDGLTLQIQLLLGSFAILLNIAIYGFVFCRSCRKI